MKVVCYTKVLRDAVRSMLRELHWLYLQHYKDLQPDELFNIPVFELDSWGNWLQITTRCNDEWISRTINARGEEHGGLRACPIDLLRILEEFTKFDIEEVIVEHTFKGRRIKLTCGNTLYELLEPNYPKTVEDY